ncbi:DNA methyltransferase [Pseudomonas sp. SO81]|uniref:DNA methyltransferase n=1 Tax=Pseudomonas sp. SO81 TaxID=2983246 RepID=UPI0025A3E8FC|nr:DNA methyltransferase [Pseudomonas sp. SO81]WJN61319.1 Superfamily II DNA/RNA, SNF2 family [Pseudomonas sp. SO81]
MTAYQDFLRAKVRMAEPQGFAVEPSVFHPKLKDHQRAIATWMVRQGRAACFAAFGLGKSVIQLEVVRVTRELAGGFALITIPLGVRQEFYRDAAMLGIKVRFIRRFEEVDDPEVIYLTNYETVRDGKLDPRLFTVASLDEASCLRGFGGSKTFREFMALFAGDDRANGIRSQGVRYRFVATATPSPNEYIELLAYSAFLSVMDVGQAKTRFFKRNSEKADQLTIHEHKEAEFWMWVASWGIFVQRPSDLGFSDEGYDLPELDIRWHEVPSDHSAAGHERNGQGRLLRNTAIGVQDAAAEKRESLPARVAKMMELRAEEPGAHRIIWHDLEAERHAIDNAIPSVVSVYGSQDIEERENAIIDFSDGKFPELSAKPVIAGSGCNFQRHCSWAIYLGIGFKFNDFIQSIHRLHRFLQLGRVRIDLIYTEAERDIRRQLERKWKQHNTMVQRMTEIIKQYGLSVAAMAQQLTRAMGVERVEITGQNYRIVNNDCVDEARRLADNSVHLTVTSIPFSTQYEYSPNYADFGHTDDNDHFFQQMDYLTPELLRATVPGRLACIHVKDRIVPGGMTGLGFQTVYPFHMQVVAHFIKHGWGYMGMKTIVTDVVRENAQTYRLSWTEQCKDGTKMGVGMPEYLLIFRKPPTDTSNAYGDVPVVKAKPICLDESGNIVPFAMDKKLTITRGNGYSRARWQFDAHGFTRSSGDRPLTEADFEGIPHDVMFKLYREYSLATVYDFEHHVRIGEALEITGKLPTGFMLLPPQSWHPDVWTDVARMRTLNAEQYSKGQEMHLCPLQFDIVDRAIVQYSMEGETVYDPFGGIMTVPYCALKLKRKAIASELNPRYFLDGAGYCKAVEEEMAMPGLFDLLDAEQEAGAA